MANEIKENGNSEFLRKVVKYASVLTAVCFISGGALSLLYVASAQRIEMQEEKAFEETIDTVLGDAENPREVIDDTLWVAEKPDGSARYVAEGTARGYQSDITVLVSADADCDHTPVSEDAPIYRMVVLSSAETPGLGENINLVERTVSLWSALLGEREEPGRPWFQAQFGGKTIDDLKIEEEEGRIQPVTGATETSTAATEAARNALRTIIEETEGGG